MKTLRWKIALPALLAALAAPTVGSMSSPAVADAGRSLTIDFEDADVFGGDDGVIREDAVERVRLGEPGARVVLNGGVATVRGLGMIYRSFPHAWLMDAGVLGTVGFQGRARRVDLFANTIDGDGWIVALHRGFPFVEVERVSPADAQQPFSFTSRRGLRALLFVPPGPEDAVLAIDDITAHFE